MVKNYDYLTDSEKSLDKIQYPVMIKAVNKLVIEGNTLNLTNCIYNRPTVKIIINSERLKVFLQGSGARQKYLTLPLLSNLYWRFYTWQLSKKKFKKYLFWKGRKKAFLFADDMTFFFNIEILISPLKTNRAKTQFQQLFKVQDEYKSINLISMK